MAILFRPQLFGILLLVMDLYGHLNAQLASGSPLWPLHCHPEDNISQPGFSERQDQEINPLEPLNGFNDRPSHDSQHHVGVDEPALQTPNHSPSHPHLGNTVHAYHQLTAIGMPNPQYLNPGLHPRYLTNAAVPLELGITQLVPHN